MYENLVINSESQAISFVRCMQDSNNFLSQLVKTLLLKDNGEPFIVESTCFGAILKLCDKLESIKTGHNEDSNKHLYKAIIDERKMGGCFFFAEDTICRLYK